MRKLYVTALTLLLAACGSDKDRSGSVDTTLPNGTAMVSGMASTDGMDEISDNMTAVDGSMNGLDAMADNMSAITPTYPPDPGSSDQPQYGIPNQPTAEPVPDTPPPYNTRSVPANDPPPN